MLGKTRLRSVLAAAALTLGVTAGHAATALAAAPTWKQVTAWDKGQNKDGSPAVSCPTSSFCAATEPSDGYVTMFNGKSWTPGQQLRTTSHKVPKLSSITCASAKFCLATGALAKNQWGNATDNVYATFNGQRWSHAVKLGSGTVSVFGGSCVSDKLCFLGAYGLGKPRGWGGVVTFDGKRWGTSLKTVGGEYSGLSCADAHFCAVASSYGGARTFNGHSWSKPVKSIKTQAVVSCPQQGFCLLVPNGGGGPYTFDGRNWHRTTPMPNPASGDDYATPASAVSCSSSRFCLVDGATQPDSTGFTWTIGFNGRGWGPPAQLEPNEPGGDSVSCPSAYFCVAAGKQGLWTSIDQYPFT
ncbi:MAG: hypothetical protein J2O48_01720 [Solirubrobacterales bacterium]|nr:hypothetical protein [Solirubrobacterales bacterium]